MGDAREKFLKILKAELEDLRADIRLVERRAVERLAHDEITEYVYKENDALFHLEDKAICDLIFVIDGIDLILYKNIEELARDLDDRVRNLVREHEDPEAVYRFFQRKLLKVRKYVESED